MSSSPKLFFIRKFYPELDCITVEALVFDRTYVKIYETNPNFPTRLEDFFHCSWFLLICHHRTGAIIGLIILQNIALHRIQLGVIMDREYCRLGNATGACIEATRRLFELIPQLHRMEAVVRVENSAGLRVMEKAGFVREGVLRNYHRQDGKRKDTVVFSFICQQLK